MSLRVDTASLISGAVVCGDRGLGVLGSEVPSSGVSGAGYMYNDLSLPADAGKEVRGLIVTPPGAGTFFAFEDSSFTFTAPDGSYSFTYRLYVDGADSGTATVDLNIGSVVTISCTPGNAAAAGVTAAVVRKIPAAPGNAVAAGVTATITAEGNTTISCTPGNAVADGAQATIANGSDITISCSPGNAAAAGATATVLRTIRATPGNAVADGVTADIEGVFPVDTDINGNQRIGGGSLYGKKGRIGSANH